MLLRPQAVGRCLWPCLPYRITRTHDGQHQQLCDEQTVATLLLDDPTGLLNHIKIGNGNGFE